MADITPPAETTEESAPPDTAPPSRHLPLVRSRDRRLIGGVADGLAAAWGWRTWLVRLLFIAATALAGLGLVLYAAGWLLIPEEGQPESIAQRIVRSMNIQRTWVGFGLLIVGGLIVGGVANIDGGILIAGALLVTGYALYTGAFALPPPNLETTAEGATPPTSVYHRAPRPARPPRPKSYLGRLTLGAMLVTLGIMGVLDAMGTARPTSRHYAAAALLVIGVGLLVGVIWGRSRGLIALGLLLLPVLAVAAIADYRFGTAWEYVTITPDSFDELQPAYSIASGNITIDLSRLEFAGETVALDLDSGVGNIYLYVPRDVALEAAGNAILGGVRVGGARSGGIGAEVMRTVDGDAGRVIVEADVRVGLVEIFRLDGEPVRPAFIRGIDEDAIEEIVGIGGVAAPLIRNDRVVRIVDEFGFEGPRNVSEIAGTYEVVDGELILDLTGVSQPEAVVYISFIGSGNIAAIVPPDARVIAPGDVPQSELSGAPDEATSGIWTRPGGGITFVIDSDGPVVTIEER